MAKEIEYTPTLLPGHPDPVWVPTCSLCGALVGNQQAHTEWHFPDHSVEP